MVFKMNCLLVCSKLQAFLLVVKLIPLPPLTNAIDYNMFPYSFFIHQYWTTY